MKKLAGLVIILAALLLGGYYGMGIITEKTIKKNIAVLDQSNGLFAEILQYDRGLFVSEARFKWQIHVPETFIETNGNGQTIPVPAKDYTAETALIIHHGPIIFAHSKVRFGLGYAESIFNLPKEYEDQFKNLFTKESTKPQIDFSIFINYLNESTIDFKVPAFNLISNKGNGHFNWSGMNALTTISSGIKKIRGTVTVNDFSFSQDETKMTLNQFLGDYDLHETLAGLYLGDANLKLPLLNIFLKDQKLFALEDLVIRSDSDIEEHVFNSHFTLNLKSLFANSQNYGPGLIEVSLRNIDADALARINQQASTLQASTETQRQQVLLSLLPEIPKLFSRGAEFEISKIDFKLPQGQIDGHAVISLPKEDNPNPMEMIQKIHGNARFKAPVVLVKELLQQSLIKQMTNQPDLQQTLFQQLQTAKILSTEKQFAEFTPEQIASLQADKQLSSLTQTGFIVVQGLDYLIEISLEQGKFNVNGKPFDASMLK